MCLTKTPYTHAAALILPRYEFQCAACETTEFRHTTALPKGWRLKRDGEMMTALCDECRAGAAR